VKLLLTLGLSLWLSLSGSSGAATVSQTKSNFGTSVTSQIMTVLWVAKDQNLFRKYGLDIQLIRMPSSAVSLSALLVGEVDMVAVGPGRLLNAATAGGDLVGVANLGNDLDYRLIARPEIKKPEDLHGKRVAISGPGSVSHIVALLALQKLGIDPRQAKITFLAIPGTEVNYRTALETGTVDAAPLNGPVGDYYSSRGYSLLYNLQTSGVAMPQDLLVTSKRILTSRAPIVEAQIKAFVEAIAYLQDARNKASVKRSVASNMRLNDETVIEETYQTVLQSYERAPYPNLDGMKQLQALLTSVNPKLKDLKTETIVDSGFISRLESSGFIQNLYKKP